MREHADIHGDSVVALQPEQIFPPAIVADKALGQRGSLLMKGHLQGLAAGARCGDGGAVHRGGALHGIEGDHELGPVPLDVQLAWDGVSLAQPPSSDLADDHVHLLHDLLDALVPGDGGLCRADDRVVPDEGLELFGPGVGRAGPHQGGSDEQGLQGVQGHEVRS